ncbi:malate synthase [Kouleothrix aurantiaca]|uniref:Malate synthase n=1 Tax=Kouleothrix aurantiaca TaxID=186479 RepID=A0A0N8PSQ4_9CHLR|nr:malate synthase [Kouleothrix aurantiaca]
MSKHQYSAGIEILGAVSDDFATVLTPEAVEFVATLQRAFNARREALLEAREARQAAIDAGTLPDFLPETADIRAGDWAAAPIPADLQDRRVEITGPVDRKMVINALNSGAKVFMADFEDANSPTWDNNIQGHINLRDAINRRIEFTNPDGKVYRLNSTVATLLVRPRGWHLLEKHMRVDGKPMSGSLFDFGLYFFHNAKTLLANGSGPYFYLPKMESHLEARLWNDVFVMAQNELGVPQGSVRATVLIETILAAFEMDEILYELRDHSAGLNCGRWDYIFSCIKKFRNHEHVFPDRALVTMTTHFMRSYSLLAIKTCHRRNIHAIGGMSAFIPVKNDEAANDRAFAQVRADKEREANDGHDGTWVAHPGMVALALGVFDAAMPQPNQIDRKREDVQVSAADLLKFADGPITEAGLRTNVSVGVQYVEAWLGGQGAVPINNLMEDAATAEISRAQVWQWVRRERGVLEDGRKIDLPLFRTVLAEELDKLRARYGDATYNARNFAKAGALFDQLISDDSFVEFLTLPGYEYLD